VSPFNSPQPTNHLDITAKEVLEEALQHYAGAVLLISHDRYFMSQVANSIFAFHDKRVDRHDCDYHDYLERQAAELAEQLAAQQREAEDAMDAALATAALAEHVARDASEEVGSGTSSGAVSCAAAVRTVNISEEEFERPRRSTRNSGTHNAEVSLKTKVTSRYVPGDKYQITNAKEVLADLSDGNRKDKKKNFGGSGITCGNLYKGIKNAKRFKDNP
jgi:ATPase subunit of ABC transporter with duplicated ATPase domains